MNSASSMQVGILQCDEVRTDFRQVHGDYNEMIIDSISKIDPTLQCTTYRIFDGEFPDSERSCDCWITTGSRQSVNAKTELAAYLENFILKADKAGRPFVGICYGMQMIAKAFGGSVVRAPTGWNIGVKTSTIHYVEPWMNCESNDAVSLLVSHEDRIDTLPIGARCIASNDSCPNAIISMGSSIIGFQGHPEFTPKYARQLMESRRGIIPNERISIGLSSLYGEIHNTQVFRWILDFMHSRWRHEWHSLS